MASSQLESALGGKYDTGMMGLGAAGIKAGAKGGQEKYYLELYA
jgi:hypothetical protein